MMMFARNNCTYCGGGIEDNYPAAGADCVSPWYQQPRHHHHHHDNHHHDKVRSQKKTILFGNFSQHWGGFFPNPKTFVNLPSIFLYAKLGPKWPQMVKNMLYWSSGIILGPLRPLWDIGKLAMFAHFWPQKGHYDKGFPKGGGGGGVRRLGKFPNNVVFFLRAYLSDT